MGLRDVLYSMVGLPNPYNLTDVPGITMERGGRINFLGRTLTGREISKIISTGFVIEADAEEVKKIITFPGEFPFPGEDKSALEAVVDQMTEGGKIKILLAPPLTQVQTPFGEQPVPLGPILSGANDIAIAAVANLGGSLVSAYLNTKGDGIDPLSQTFAQINQLTGQALRSSIRIHYNNLYGQDATRTQALELAAADNLTLGPAQIFSGISGVLKGVEITRQIRRSKNLSMTPNPLPLPLSVKEDNFGKAADIFSKASAVTNILASIVCALTAMKGKRDLEESIARGYLQGIHNQIQSYKDPVIAVADMLRQQIARIKPEFADLATPERIEKYREFVARTVFILEPNSRTPIGQNYIHMEPAKIDPNSIYRMRGESGKVTYIPLSYKYLMQRVPEALLKKLGFGSNESTPPHLLKVSGKSVSIVKPGSYNSQLLEETGDQPNEDFVIRSLYAVAGLNYDNVIAAADDLMSDHPPLVRLSAAFQMGEVELGELKEAIQTIYKERNRDVRRVAINQVAEILLATGRRY